MNPRENRELSRNRETEVFPLSRILYREINYFHVRMTQKGNPER